MCAVHDGRCSPWVMCSVVSGNRIHDSYIQFTLKYAIKMYFYVIRTLSK